MDFHQTYPTALPNNSALHHSTCQINATFFAFAVMCFHQQQNSATPRKLTGAFYTELNRLFVPLEITTSSDNFVSWYPTTYNLGWEDSKYVGHDVL